ncbi:MAG: hypothetical protein AB1589_45635, partial [Cyanobacteriota bacterium]
MHDAEKLRTFVARLLRRINVHQAMVEARDVRFRDLLKKSLTEDLTDDEQKELEELQFERTAVIVSDETSRLQRLEKALDTLEYLKSSFLNE